MDEQQKTPPERGQWQSRCGRRVSGGVRLAANAAGRLLVFGLEWIVRPRIVRPPVVVLPAKLLAVGAGYIFWPMVRIRVVGWFTWGGEDPNGTHFAVPCAVGKKGAPSRAGGHAQCCGGGPLYPQERTLLLAPRMSASSQKRTFGDCFLLRQAGLAETFDKTLHAFGTNRGLPYQFRLGLGLALCPPSCYNFLPPARTSSEIQIKDQGVDQ